MNKYTVGRATQGLANYIIKQNKKDKGVAIAYDCRHMSEEFSMQSALILNANGIKTYRFEELRPTPELSFTIRYLGCVSGIIITASHNPPNYNGYKVYWEDGSQVSTPMDDEVIAEVNAITDYSTIKTMELDEAIQKGLFHAIGEDIDRAYLDELQKLIINPGVIERMSDDLRIVYTPLHGTGGPVVKRNLEEIGFKHVYPVEKQMIPDPNFSTVKSPNPEDPDSFEMALELAKEVNADIVLSNDPDADRLGLFVKDTATGEYICFSGNMLAMIIVEYILTQRKEKDTLPKNAAIIKTIVSTNMTDTICKANDVALFEVLTGFKFIAAQMRVFEENNNSHEFIMGFEESFGCMIGEHARDKDGIVSIQVLAEAAAFYKEQGITLWDQLVKMYEKYGYYKEEGFSVVFEGAEGAQKIKTMMNTLRGNPPQRLGGYKVLAVRDYESGRVVDFVQNTDDIVDLPEHNLLYYELENDFWVATRPSGTEPKIKFYIGVKGSSLEDARTKVKDLTEAVRKLIS